MPEPYSSVLRATVRRSRATACGRRGSMSCTELAKPCTIFSTERVTVSMRLAVACAVARISARFCCSRKSRADRYPYTLTAPSTRPAPRRTSTVMRHAIGRLRSTAGTRRHEAPVRGDMADQALADHDRRGALVVGPRKHAHVPRVVRSREDGRQDVVEHPALMHAVGRHVGLGGCLLY